VILLQIQSSADTISCFNRCWLWSAIFFFFYRRNPSGKLAAAVNQFFSWGYRNRDILSWIEINTSFRRPIFLSIVPLFPLFVIGYMDQFWSTLVIYPNGISPSSGKKS